MHFIWGPAEILNSVILSILANKIVETLAVYFTHNVSRICLILGCFDNIVLKLISSESMVYFTHLN